jgi:hypothetical protein
MKNYLILFLSAFTIASCGGGRSHPKMLSFTPASVVIDYSDNDLHEATALAQQFCSSTNKDAQYVRTEENGWGSWGFKESKAFFNCVASEKHHNQNTGGAGSNMPIINNFK